jgi:glyoxylase-like metal-dependent hydrolase (beta-lactamase superfamily II)
MASEVHVGLLALRLGFVKAFVARGTAGNLLIDTGTRGSLPAIADRLGREGVALKDTSVIVITHAHPDHTGGLADVVQATGAKVIAHRLEAEVLSTRPDVTVDDELDLSQYGVSARIIWTPGHSRGSLSVIMGSGEAVVGDLVLPRFMAFGPPAIAFWAASREDSLASIRRVLDLKPSIIHTSHGGPYGSEALAKLAR